MIITFTIVSSTALYLYSERISLDSQREANEKVLLQMNYNVTYMNEIAKNFAVSMFFDLDIISLLNDSNWVDIDQIQKINRINKKINSNSFIHSLVLYNSKKNEYFTGGNLANREVLINTMDDYLSGRKQMNKMQFIPIKFPAKSNATEQNIDVFSLFMYDSLTQYSKSQSALIINIKPEWLFQNIEIMNGFSANKAGRMFIMDQNSEAFSPTLYPNIANDELKKRINQQIKSTNKTASQFTYTSNHQKQIVNYIINSPNNWIIVNVQPYEELLGAVKKIRIASIIIILVSILLAAIVSLFVSNKLYNPVERLLRQFRRPTDTDLEQATKKERFDELHYMSAIYSNVMDKLNVAETTQDMNESIVKSYYLRKLIMDSSSFSPEELRECAENQRFKIDMNNPLLVGVIQIDNYRSFSESKTIAQQKLYHFALTNICEEIISEHMTCEIIEARSEHLVLLVNIKKDYEAAAAQLPALIQRIQAIMTEYYHVTFTAALSEPSSDYREITYHYGKALEYLMYRMNYGTNSLITPQMVQTNLENQEQHIPSELEKKLVEAIKSNHLESVTDQINKIQIMVSRMNSDAVFLALMHLSVIISQTLREMNYNKLSPILIDLRTLKQNIIEKETLEEIFSEIIDLFSKIFTEQSEQEGNKSNVIVDIIKEIILTNYSDMNLSLQGISAMLKMSSVYVGRVFKKQEDISVAEYINELRLSKSIELLVNHNLTIHEIVEKVGFGNQNYYFKMFKNKFGTTPKEYRIKKSLN
ncbi:helix-turn-helix domain-containing protein [Paenibacillus psychroresistens]|nr:helix-turn-helix domain-containing protein [Paenibacillus psychroresistens]